MDRIPKNELKKVIDAQFNYDRRKYIFWAFNTTYFGIALFQIYSDVNIEGGENIALCQDAIIFEEVGSNLICPSNLYSALVALVLAHLMQIFASTIGYFGIDQKSKKINKSYSYLLVLSYLFALISTIVLISQYGDLDETPFKNTRSEFLMLLILFPIIQGFICYFCLYQFKKATTENACINFIQLFFFYKIVIQKVKEELLELHPQIIHDIVKLFL